MALELAGGAALGVLFDQLHKGIWRVKDNVVKFKPELEQLERTLTVLCPVIKEIEELNRRSNRPNHGIETIFLTSLLKDGTELVSKCSKIPGWEIFKQGRHREKLVELHNKISMFLNVCLVAYMARDVKQALQSVQETRQMMITLLNQPGFSNITMGFTDSSEITTASPTGSSNMTVGIAASSSGSSNMTVGIAASSSGSSNMTVGFTDSSENTTASPTGSSNMTVGIATSSTDAHGHSLKIVMKVEMPSEKCRVKALKVAACVYGVNAVAIEGADRDKVVVLGYADAVKLANRLREKVGYACILCVEQIKSHSTYR